jgi:hypothetical protein
MLLATLFPAYNASDFDLEAAVEAPKRLVVVPGQATEWVEAELREGRDEALAWKRTDWPKQGDRQTVSWKCECNEHGTDEEWLLVLEDVPFWKP